MDSWETSGSRGGVAGVTRNQWEGEDEEEEVLDSWDQEEPAEKPQTSVANNSASQTSASSKKKKRDKYGSGAHSSFDPILDVDMTPEEKLADKLHRQKLQEESDLVLAKEIFGVSSNGVLETKDDFDRFLNEIDARVTACAKNSEYLQFTEQLVQSLCLHLSASDLKRVHNVVGNLHIEKLKLEKGDKTKKNKSKNKVKLRVDQETDYNEYSAYTTDEFDLI